MAKYRLLTPEEEEVLRRNGLDPKAGYAVALAGEGYLHLIHYKTRDMITIRQGDRPGSGNSKEG